MSGARATTVRLWALGGLNPNSPTRLLVFGPGPPTHRDAARKAEGLCCADVEGLTNFRLLDRWFAPCCGARADGAETSIRAHLVTIVAARRLRSEGLQFQRAAPQIFCRVWFHPASGTTTRQNRCMC